MAITYIGDTSSAINVVSPIPAMTEAAGTVPIVGGLAEGDVMFRLFSKFAINGGAAAVTGAGWTHVINNSGLQVFCKVATATEVAAGGFPWIGASEQGWAYRGVDQTTPIHATNNGTSVTTTADNKQIVHCASVGDNTVPSALSNATHRWWSRTAFSTDAAAGVADKFQAAAGTSTAVGWTWAGGLTVSSFALNEAPATHDMRAALTSAGIMSSLVNVEGGAQFVTPDPMTAEGFMSVRLSSRFPVRSVPEREHIWVCGIDGTLKAVVV